ncbi:MAG TPA: hypothetical protein VGB45_06750 [Abditibacterium sp.]|jgi:hypothetical protein
MASSIIMQNDRSPFESSTSSGVSRPPSGSASGARIAGTKFQFKRQILKLVGAAFYLYDETGAVVLYADQKAFKLKEDIRVYTGEDKTIEVFRISARRMMDWSGTYDVFDANSQKIGALRRQGMKSMVRDEWTILDVQDREIGLIQEDSTALALLRRFVDLVSLLVPQKYSLTLVNRPVGQFARVFNPFSSKIDVDFSADPSATLDRRLALAAGVLLCAIEGKQG